VARPVRFAAIGDALMTLPLVTRRNPGDHVTSFSSASPLNWLRVLAPEIDLPEHRILGVQGENTVKVARRIADVTALSQEIDAALVCVGLQDCFAMITGTAPDARDTIGGLESIVAALLDASITPFVILPPPCVQFANGLFADRYLAIAASLRRMARQTPGMVLVDPTDQMKGQEAFGIEPADGMSSGDEHGRLTPHGAVTLAGCVRQAVQDFYGTPAGTAPKLAHSGLEALNDNPFLLAGMGGALAGPASKGQAPAGFQLDTTHSAGIRAFSLVNTQAGTGPTCQISCYGRYSSKWCFVRLFNSFSPEALDSINPGDVLEAIWDYELAGPLRNVTLVYGSLTADWTTDYMAVASTDNYDRLTPAQPHAGVLRTPRLTIPEKLSKLSVLITVFFAAGDNLDASATLNLNAVIVRKVR
jgi:hypothetical protein